MDGRNPMGVQTPVDACPAFSKLMADTTEWVLTSFPTDGPQVTERGMADLLGGVCTAVPRDLRVEAFQAAVGLARSDGMTKGEVPLLEWLGNGLEIDRGLAREMLARNRRS